MHIEIHDTMLRVEHYTLTKNALPQVVMSQMTFFNLDSFPFDLCTLVTVVPLLAMVRNCIVFSSKVCMAVMNVYGWQFPFQRPLALVGRSRGEVQQILTGHDTACIIQA